MDEIESARLQPEEEAELVAQRSRLEHVERLRQAALTALQALAGQDDEHAAATELLAEAVAACQDAGRIDLALAAEADALQGSLAQAEESARNLRDYVDNLEADPTELERIVERLFRIGDLKRKYGDSVDDVLAYAESAREQLTEIANRSERLEELGSLADRLQEELRAAADVLSSKRKTAAERLADAVGQELRDLRLADSAFEVTLEPIDVESMGADRVDFRMGQEGRLMGRVASGGELARIALALKTVLTRAETRPTLIFDEIDVGVGGRTGPVVGQKLWSVAAGGHQVLCVTHMPQVAAFADSHYVVSRASGEVCVAEVSGDQRIDEVAAMLAGSATQAARRSAEELLTRAAAAKKSASNQFDVGSRRT
jgi:DNA repair protein RecN (Recombination protein N)